MTDDSRPSPTLSREELYNLVWQTPLSRLCKQYDVPYHVLRTLCGTHRIPVPVVGFWARKRLGQAVAPTPLPICDDESLRTVTIAKPVKRSPASVQHRKQSPAFDDEIADLLKRAKRLAIKVSDRARRVHPLVRATRDILQGSKPDTNNLIYPSRGETRPFLNVRVSRGSIDRALCVMDAMIKSIESLGGRIDVRKGEWDVYPETLVCFGPQDCEAIRIRESWNIRPQPPSKHEEDWWATGPCRAHVPSGCFWFYVRYRELYKEKQPGDVNENLNAILVSIVRRMGETRIALQREEQARQREEEDELHERDILGRQRREQERLQALRREAAAWSKSQSIRAYLGAIRAQHPDVTAGSDLHQWLVWASEQADRLDPLLSNPLFRPPMKPTSQSRGADASRHETQLPMTGL